jgi:gliding motility-associated-like protein
VEDKDNIKDLFGDKLGGFEANVRPELWANISTQIASTTVAVSSTGASLITKIIISVSVAASVATVSYFVFSDKNNNVILPSKTISKPEQKNKLIISDTKITEVKNTRSVNENLGINLINEYLPELINNGLEERLSSVNITAENNTVPVLIIKENMEYVNSEDVTHTLQNNNIQTETVESETEEIIESVEYLGTLPNIFTPNSDGVNDVLSIESTELSEFSVVVIDKNSKIVYQSNDANFIWDGTGLNGEIVSKGTYIYYITARNSKGELISKHNMLNIETGR